jgi:hypothetical protein
MGSIAEDGDSRVVQHEDGTRTHRVTLWYPGVPPVAGATTTIDAVEVQLVHVRAARDIRITYDFDRDGYVIAAQADPGEPGPEANSVELPYVEVAFVPAWEPEKKTDGQ